MLSISLHEMELNVVISRKTEPYNRKCLVSRRNEYRANLRLKKEIRPELSLAVLLLKIF